MGAARLSTLQELRDYWGVNWWVLFSVNLVVSQPLPAFGHPPRGELGEGFDWA